MKKLLLFLSICVLPFISIAQPLSCNIKIGGTSFSNYDICIGEDFILNGTPTGGTLPYTHSWTGSGGQISPTSTQNPTFSAATVGTFSISYTVTDAALTTSTCNITITVNPLPNLFTSLNQRICLGDCINLSGVTTTGDGIIWYEGFVSSPTQWSTPTINVCPTVTTEYYALAYISGTGCIRTRKVTVYVTDLQTTATAVMDTICNGDCTNITANPTGGFGLYSYNWSNGGTAQTINVCPTINTTYTVTVTDETVCSATASVTIVVNPQLPPVIHSDTLVCFNTCATLTATGSGSNWVWSTTETSATVIVCPAATTTYSVTMTDNNGCTGTDEAIVTVNPLLTADAGADNFICYGNTTAIGGSPTASGGAGSYTYSWSPATGLSNAAISNPIANPTITTTYCVTVTDGQGCSASDCMTLTVNPLLTANAGTAQEICDGTCTVIGANPAAIGGTPSYTYQWNPIGGLSDPLNPNPTACPSSSTTYSLTVTDALGCTASNSMVLTVNPPPTADAGNPQTICSGSCINIGGAPTASNGASPYIYSWVSAPAGFTSTSANPSVCPTVTTTYSLTVTDSKGCSATDYVVISVNPSPTADAGPPVTICSSICVALGGAPTATGGTPGYSYQWSPAATLDNPTLDNPLACPLVTTTYTVTVTDANNCTASSSVTITVNQATATATANPATICQYQSSIITATGGTYIWDTGATTPSINVTPNFTTTYCVTVTALNGCTASACATVTVNVVNATATSAPNPVCPLDPVTLTATGGVTYAWSNGAGNTDIVIVNPAVTTTYTVTVTALNGCSNTAQVTVNVNTVNISLNATQNPVCVPGCTDITATGGGTYLWSNGATTPTINVCPSSTTTYCVTVTSTNGCTASQCITITVNSATISANANPNPICAGQCTDITASGGINYVWNTGVAGTTINVCPVVTTVYTVTGTAANGCTATASVTVTVNTVTATATANPNPICSGQCSQLTATGGGTYDWSNGMAGSPITVCPLVTTTYIVTVTALNGCTATAQVTVNVNSVNPTITATPNPICLGESTTITATGGGTYLWSPGGATTVSITVSPAVTTQYCVTVTNGCSASTCVNVVVNSATITASASPNPICAGQCTDITASGGVSYIWNTGLTTSTINVCPLVTTTYTVTGTGANGCTASTSVTVTVNTVTPTISASLNPICAGQTTILTAGGGGTYLWSTGATATSISVSPVITTSYCVTVTGANGCTGSTCLTINVANAPVANAGIDQTICAGQCANLTAIGGDGYLWSPGGQNSASINVCPIVTTTYNVTVTLTGCSLSSTDNVTVFVNPVPIPIVTSTPTSICLGDCSTLSASGGVGGATYTWNTTPAQNGQSINVCPLTTTTYSVTITNPTGCSASGSATVTVNTPVMTLTATPNPVCPGQNVLLTATGGGTYLWNTGATTSTTTVNPFITTTYCVTVTNINGCSVSNCITVNVSNGPTISVTSSSNPSICGACDGSITVSASGGLAPYSYLWGTTPTQVTPAANNLCSGIYIVTVSDANSCSASSVTTLNDPGLISVTLTSSDLDNQICANECVTFTANSASAISYEFFIGGTTVQGPGALATYTSCSLTNGQTLTVKAVDISGCTAFASQTFVVNPLPILFSVTGGGSFCIGTSGAQVGLNGSQSGVTYTLYFNGSPIIPMQTIAGTGSSISFGNQNVSGTYTVTAGNNTTFCTNNMAGNVVINANPTPVIFNLSGTTSYCAGGIGVPICLIGSEIGIVYQIYINGFLGPTLNGTGTGICFSNQTTAGTFTAIALNPLTGCQSNMTGSAVVTINELPIAYGVNGSGSYCAGGTGIQICVGNSQVGINYQLYLGGVYTGIQTPGTGSGICFSNQTAVGNFTVMALNPSTGCSTLMNGNALISTYPVPTANAGSDATICQWSNTPLNASGAGINGSYIWSPTLNLSSSTINNPIASPQSTTSYFVTVTDINGCTASDDVVVTVLPFNLPTVSATDTGFCIGETINSTLIANPTGYYTSFAWNDPLNQVSPSIVVTQTGIYHVTATAPNGCAAVSPDIAITVYPPIPPPVILINGLSSLCQRDSVKLYLNNPYYTYEWSSGSINEPEIYVTETEHYYVTVTDFFGCIDSAGPAIITVNPLPEAVIGYMDSQSPLFWDFYNYSLYGNNYTWTFGDPSSASNIDFNENCSHNFSSVGWYTVTLTASNGCGSDIATAIVNVHMPYSGITENSNLSDVLIYPNPFDEQLNFEFSINSEETISISIINSLGETVNYYDKALSSGKHHIINDLTLLSDGVYYVKLISKNFVITKKIIKS